MLSQNNSSPVIPSREGEDLHTLIQKAKQGDKNAFEYLFQKLYTPLFRYIYSRTKSTEVAEDISQQTFLRFYEALPRYEDTRGEDGLRSYLFTIAKRLFINAYEKEKRFENIDDDLLELVSDESVDIIHDVDVALLSKKIDVFVSELRDAEQEVMRLHFSAELTHKEIAVILGKSEDTVRKIKERALSKIRARAKHLHE